VSIIDGYELDELYAKLRALESENSYLRAQLRHVPTQCTSGAEVAWGAPAGQTEENQQQCANCSRRGLMLAPCSYCGTTALLCQGCAAWFLYCTTPGQRPEAPPANLLIDQVVQ